MEPPDGPLTPELVPTPSTGSPDPRRIGWWEGGGEVGDGGGWEEGGGMVGGYYTLLCPRPTP